MSHTFDCVVDTSDLARSVDSMKRHVDSTTGAVVAMKTAVLKAEEDGARNVCRKVNQGFYALIHSQISQKMAAVQSRVDARYMRLAQQTKQLAGIRQRMERDYQMISARYAKLFGALGRSLRQRVAELDRPIMDFATTEADKVTSRPNRLVACVSLGQSESVSTSQRIAASGLKARASDAVSAIRRFISASDKLRAVTDRILLPRRTDAPMRRLTVPVVVLESVFDSSGNTVTQTYVSDLPMAQEARSTIAARLAEQMSSGAVSWRPSAAIHPEVAGRFRTMVAEANLDPARRQAMLRMFEARAYDTF